MRFCLPLLCVLLFIAAPAAAQESRYNVLLICVDDLRPELGCYGVDYIKSPNIDALAESGVTFLNHFVQAPTCGASRYSLLTGNYGPSSNGALFSRAKKLGKRSEIEAKMPSLPGWFRAQGYTTVSVGKVSHHPGGRGGRDWNEDAQPEMPGAWSRHLMPVGDWQHPRGAMHGLARGEIRIKAGEMDLFQAAEGPDDIYPDGLTTDESLKQLDLLIDEQEEAPFLLAVGIIRPHLPFGAPARYLEPYRDVKLPPIPHPTKPESRTTWHGSGEFMKYNRWKRDPRTDAEFATEVRRHYAACVTYADAQVGRILARLEERGARSNTIVVLWGDHGWHLGEHAIWGKHALFDESLHSPLIISAPKNTESGGREHSIVETVDIFPTLCELAGVSSPAGLDGRSLAPRLADPDTEVDGEAISYARAKTIRTPTHRLILHSDGYAELYDHTTAAAETKNVASEQPEVVERLTRLLRDRLQQGE